MFAQAYSYQFDLSQVGAHMQFAEQVVASDLRQQPSFQGMRLLVDRRRRRALGISYWASEAAALAAAERAANPPAPPQGVQIPETRNLEIETYEVLLDQPTASE